MNPLKIIIFLYDGMTALDAIGVYEVLRLIPDAQVEFVAKQKGTIRMDSRMLSLVAEQSIEDVQQADILVLPGGATTHDVMQDQAVIDWVQYIHTHAKWTLSVCTGAGFLLKAGLLNNQPTTTHWASLQYVEALGGIPSNQRIVQTGKIITAAGVSAGIDAALMLVALERDESLAKAIQLVIEYDPQPPFDSGSIDKAAPATIDQASELLNANVQRAIAD
ncbi:DJ-1/PfpI family protein [Pseudanabaenaceae cyanobacterium LEGE 13415]|nr:DJ-1/PfpI family protein [Pseudanabaenaceae cyanobacterium LEGE 13415]